VKIKMEKEGEEGRGEEKEREEKEAHVLPFSPLLLLYC